jgi:hypothetical protein
MPLFCITYNAGFPYSLSLHHANNRLENSCNFYLSLLNTLAKKTILGQKKYWKGICPHHCTPQVKPKPVPAPNPFLSPVFFYLLVHAPFNHFFSTILLVHSTTLLHQHRLLCHEMRRWSSMKKRWGLVEGGCGVSCNSHGDTAKSYLGPLRPTAAAHVAKVSVPIKVYTMVKRLSRTSLTKPGFNPRAFINISVCIIRIHHCSTSPSGPESTPRVPLTLCRSSAQLGKLEVPSK